LSEKIREFIELTVDLVNKEVNVSELKAKYSPGENRTLAFMVTDGESQYGFVFEPDRIKATDEIEKPTVIVSTDESTFWKIITKKTTLDHAVATRRLRVAGDYFLRDFVILRNMFKELRRLLRL